MKALTRTAQCTAAIGLLMISAAASADTFSGTRLLPVGTDSPIVTTPPSRVTTEATVVLPSPPAGPLDRKTFAGSFCKPDRGRDADTVDYRLGGIEGRDDHYAVVVCPIARDNTVNSDGVSVTVYVKSVSDDLVACTLWSRTAYGEEVARQTRQAADWGKSSIELRVPAGEDSGYYVMVCNLIDGNRLYSYTVSEFTDTGVDY